MISAVEITAEMNTPTTAALGAETTIILSAVTTVILNAVTTVILTPSNTHHCVTPFHKHYLLSKWGHFVHPKAIPTKLNVDHFYELLHLI